MEEIYYNSLLDKYFEILGVSKDASFDEIKKAYRKLAMKYHPDRNPGDEEAAKKMQEVNNAYDILQSNESRKKWVRKNEWQQQNAKTSDRNYRGNPNDRQQKSSYQERAQRENYSQGQSGNNSYGYGARSNDQNSQRNRSYGYGNGSYYNNSQRNRYSGPFTYDDDDTFRYNRNTQTKPNFKDYKEFWKYIKEEYEKAYKKVRAAEKSYTFSDRVDDILEEVEYWEFYQDIESKLGKIGVRLSSLIIGELFYQFAKLKPEKGENFPTYTVKNRKTIATALLIAMLFNPLGAKAEDVPNEPSTNTGTTVEDPKTPESDADVLVDEYCLNRIYKVKSGDTLSSISAESNTTMNHIAEVNGLNSYDLKVGQTIKIPYYIDKEDLQYYTTTVDVENYRDLEQLAKAYETDLRTLYSINAESFIKVDEQYATISDTILVPTFPTRQEVKDQKNNNNNSYRKTPNN